MCIAASAHGEIRLGQPIGWYGAGEGAGFLGAIVGAVIVLAIWGFISSRSTRA